jgi:predicted small integral membrane protein
MIVRLCKAALVATVALLMALVAAGNVFDYGANWQFVRHVLAMDTIFPDSPLGWRAIESPGLQTAAYLLLIAWEIATAAVLVAAAARLLAAAPSAERFASGRPLAVAGLTMVLVLYGAAFLAIGGEWFLMWQSTTWNGQEAAFRFFAVAGIVLLVVLAPEA